MPKLVWFRRDLRVTDNTALHHACEAASDGVIALFIITSATWKQHALGNVQLSFLLDNLKALSTALDALHIPLLILDAKHFEAIPRLLKKLVLQHEIDAVYFNREYEWDEQQRDQAVTQDLTKEGIKVLAFDDQVVIAPTAILNQKNEPFKVFTPFKKKWLSMVSLHYHTPYPKPKAQKKLSVAADAIPNHITGFSKSIVNHDWVSGEKASHKELLRFTTSAINDYHQHRDFPALNGTSRLSPYLAIGILSPRQCIASVMQAQHLHNWHAFEKPSGVSVWISELIWREFYKMILFHFPAVCKHRAFQSYTDQLPWRYDEDLFNAWCNGNTGFPLVDAAMRQLNQTGWMHNRLRMLAAMFLSKNAFIDWRWGERYFSEHLIDYDFSANNGGWQWSASTGTDAAPYFRIFNPILQSERFDADGVFIRKYCPELLTLDNQTIHDPYGCGASPLKLKYPKPIVDYKKMRAFVIAQFKKLHPEKT